MEVMDTPFRAGDLRHGYQASPTTCHDRGFTRKKAARKLFFKNFMVLASTTSSCRSRRLMRADQCPSLRRRLMMDTNMHEIARSCPAFSRHGGDRKTFEIHRPRSAVSEEARLTWLACMACTGSWAQLLPKERMEEYYGSYLAGIFAPFDSDRGGPWTGRMMSSTISPAGGFTGCFRAATQWTSQSVSIAAQEYSD